MTIQHLFYIPTIFLLGLVFGIMISERRVGIRGATAIATDQSNYQFQYKTSGRKLFLIFLIFLLVFLITHMFEIPWGSKYVSHLLGGQEIFDKKPVFSATEVYTRMDQFSTQGIVAYKGFTYTIDVLFPISFFVFLFTFARFVSQRIILPKYIVTVLISLPFLWFASDMVENAVIFHILSKFPEKSWVFAGWLGYITTIKFGLLLFSILAPSLLFILGKKDSVQQIK